MIKPASVALLILLSIPSVSAACDFTLPSDAELYRRASIVFVGKVVESPWESAATGAPGAIGNDVRVIRFAVQRQFRGQAVREIEIPVSLTDCFYPYLKDETYLVHGLMQDGELIMGYPWRPLPLKEATDALKFVESASAQAFLSGTVRLRSPAGLISSASHIPELFVHAEGAAGHGDSKVDHTYWLVLPPGEYDVWIERNGAPVTSRRTVRLVRGGAAEENFELAAPQQ